MTRTRQDVSNSLREFKRRRDSLLHDDANEMEYHLQRFIEFSNEDPMIQEILDTLPHANSEEWWGKLQTTWFRLGAETWEFPKDTHEEMALRYALMKDIAEKRASIHDFGNASAIFRSPDIQQRFLSLIVRSFCEYLSDRLAELANIPSEETRALQAVPLNRIPGVNETRIFLSHKTHDKDLVRRYARVLKELGFNPWLDEVDMPVGTNLDRGIIQGFEESCAAIFFITQNFKDEKFIEDEINYAKLQKRAKGDKFAIITLRFFEDAPIPKILEPYRYFDVKYEIDGIYEIVRALPIQLGDSIWKEGVNS